MSVMLLGSSFVTAVLIPPEAFQPGGPADGRALAYLAHERLGPTYSARSTTSARSRFSGSPARRRSPDC